ncbi:MAG TPA: DUF2797 domain-containing protein [Gammaproteobacteria bacterium]|nr:DUF2797 domain-containing protein [Gammaproteobacteria bacterium]
MITGNISKMGVKLGDSVIYELPIGNEKILLNPLLGKSISLTYTGNIHCINCGRKTKKSYSQGHCYPCMKKLASCDMCIMKPETCHYAQGTCREPEWGEAHCMQPHFVYLANSSGLKVGITRETQIPTRWIDQGAMQALAIAVVQTRYQVGLMEVILKNHVNDKTDWRKMLKNEVEPIDLVGKRDALLSECSLEISELQAKFGEGDIQLTPDAEPVTIHYPVLQYPQKVKALNFDKNPKVSGILEGIKGQYLILDTGVLNIRKFTGYELTFQ